jgi:hypothetical protein
MLNKDPSFYDHKHISCGFKYEIGVLIYEPKIAWIKLPIKCGKGDHGIFQDNGLKEKLGSTPGKWALPIVAMRWEEQRIWVFDVFPTSGIYSNSDASSLRFVANMRP